MDDTVYDVPLDAEEQELLDSVERGEWVQIPNMEEEIQSLKQAARAFLEQKREYSVLITREELIEAKQVLSTQLEYGDLQHEVDRPGGLTSNQIIKSLLDKINAAIESQSFFSTSS
jgi:predicted DNA binding CopG/RHH family protein